MTTIIENLHALREQIDAMIAAVSADGTGNKPMAQLPKAVKVKAEKAEKKPRANAGQSTLHGAWTKHVLQLHGPGAKALHPKDGSADYQAFMAARIASAKAGELLYKDKSQARVKSGEKKIGDAMDEAEAKVGAHIPFVGYWKAIHPEEHAAFKLEWEAANPKGSRAASVADDSSEAGSAAESDGQPKKRGAKKMADMTEEERTAARAKRAANKLAKASKKAESEEKEAENFSMAAIPSAAVGGGGAEAAPAAAPAAAEEAADDELELEPEDKLIAFTHKKVSYLRYGHLDEDGEGVWWEGGDLWLQKEDGSKGAYAGQLQASGKIDSSPAIMAAEPDIN